VITVTVDVAIDTAGTITNIASVAGGGELNAVNDVTIDITTVLCRLISHSPHPHDDHDQRGAASKLCNDCNPSEQCACKDDKLHRKRLPRELHLSSIRRP